MATSEVGNFDGAVSFRVLIGDLGEPQPYTLLILTIPNDQIEVVAI